MLEHSSVEVDEYYGEGKLESQGACLIDGNAASVTEWMLERKRLLRQLDSQES